MGVFAFLPLERYLNKVKLHEVTKQESMKKVTTVPSPKQQLKSWALNRNTRHQGTDSYTYLTSLNWSCCAKHLWQPPRFLPAVTTPPLTHRLTHVRDHLVNQIMEPIKTKTSCAWGKSEGSPQSQVRSFPNMLCVQQDKCSRWNKWQICASWKCSWKHRL